MWKKKKPFEVSRRLLIFRGSTVQPGDVYIATSNDDALDYERDQALTSFYKPMDSVRMFPLKTKGGKVRKIRTGECSQKKYRTSAPLVRIPTIVTGDE